MDNGIDSKDSSIAGASKQLEASNEFLEKLDYVSRENKENPYCVICDLRLSADGVNDHITSEAHLAEFHYYGCDGIINGERKGYRCSYCLEKLRSAKRVYRHVTRKKHLGKMVSAKKSSQGKLNNVMKISKNYEKTPFVGISKLNDLLYICHICNRDSGLQLNFKDVDNHIAGKRHRSFLSENFCNDAKIIETEALRISKNLSKSSVVKENSLIKRENSVKSIDSKETNSNEIDLGIKMKIEENPEMNDNDFETEFHRRLFTSFFDKNITYFYTCFICVRKNGMDYSVFGKNKDKLLNAHIRGEQHGATMIKFGCDNIIAKGKRYYCQTCSTKMSCRNKVYEHIQREDHLRLTKIFFNDRMSYGVVPKDLFIYTIKKKSTWIADIYYCWVCGEDDYYVPQKCLNGHLASELHNDSLNKYGCKTISRRSDNYYCNCCKIEFDDMKKVFFHVKEEDHINQYKKRNDRRKISESEMKINSKIEDNDKEIELHCRLFTSLFDNGKRIFHNCFICVMEFENNYSVYGKNKDKLLNAHIRGEFHGASVVKFGCDKIIDNGKKYYCETCRIEMNGRKKVLNHVQNENHLRLVKTLLNDRMNFDVALNDFFIYAIKQKSNFITDTYHCWICDGISYVAKKSLKAHLTSKLHRDSLKKYGCQYISRRYDRYYCNCCENEFDNMKNVFFHVKEENHIKQKSIVLHQEDNNMISNFTLEEKSESSKILNDFQSEFNELEREENTKILIDNRDFSLHYISSDPEILCKRYIPKSLQNLAKKIEKQQEDNPYCLICNFEIPGYLAIDDHIKGKFHAESLLRNGCDKILQRIHNNTLRFSCELCNCLDVQRIETIYLHIRTKAHLLKVRNARPELFESRRKKAKKKNDENLAPQTFTDLYKLQSSNFDSQAIVNYENNEQPLNFNSIFSSISDDLSRMLSHLEIGSQAKGAKKKILHETKNQNSTRTKNGKKKKTKKKRFPQTSPDRDGGFVCNVCQNIFPRKAELHQHMTIHFGQEFERFDSDENDSTDEENFEIEEENSKIEEENAKDSEENFPELIFR